MKGMRRTCLGLGLAMSILAAWPALAHDCSTFNILTSHTNPPIKIEGGPGLNEIEAEKAGEPIIWYKVAGDKAGECSHGQSCGATQGCWEQCCYEFSPMRVAPDFKLFKQTDGVWECDEANTNRLDPALVGMAIERAVLDGVPVEGHTFILRGKGKDRVMLIVQVSDNGVKYLASRGDAECPLTSGRDPRIGDIPYEFGELTRFSHGAMFQDAPKLEITTCKMGNCGH